MLKNKSYFLLLILLSLISFSKANIINITPQGKFQNLKSAYDIAKDGDTILIAKGSYKTPNLVISKSLIFIGETGAEIISESGGEILSIQSDGVVVKNLTFKGVITNYLKENAAIRLIKSKNFSIENNYFKNCFFGIYIENSREGSIIKNIIEGNAENEANSGNGIHAWYCQKLQIYYNKITNNRDGIYFEFVDKSHIAFNESFKNLRYGLHFMFSNDDSYLFNTFENNGVGVAVMFSKNIAMYFNKFLRNWGTATYGLLLKEIYDAQIEHNEFIENTIGINVETSTRIRYANNNFIRNGWAVKSLGGSDDNQFLNNNFINNSLDLLMTNNSRQTKIEGNYWSNYSGYDLDKDGIGDVPFYPVKLYSYILNEQPESVILMRSLFVDILNFSEKISPVFTPKEVKDDRPKMSENI